MWVGLSVVAIIVNTFLCLASGAGGAQGAEAIGYIIGAVVGFPAFVAAILALFPANRNMKSFSKAFFFTSILAAITLLSKLGEVVQQAGG